MKNKIKSVPIPEDLKKRGEKKAKELGISFNALIRMSISKFLEGNK